MTLAVEFGEQGFWVPMNITVKKINLIQIGYLEFRTNLRSFRVIILVFRTISHYLNSKTEFGPGLEQFQQIRTILRFLDPIWSYYSNF